MDFQLSLHVLQEIQRRGISKEVLTEILKKPGQIVPAKYNHVCYQTIIEIDGSSKP